MSDPTRLPPPHFRYQLKQSDLAKTGGSHCSFLEQLIEFRGTLMLTSLIKDTVKTTDEHPDEEIYKE